MCVYEIRFAAAVVHDLNALRAADRRLIMDRIQRRLRHEPTRRTKHVKQLRKLVLPFEHVPPIWQLRTGDHRAVYDVDDAKRLVFVRAVWRTPSPTTTPAAVLLGVEGKDWESVVFETSPGFWKLIEARRREPTLSAEEVEESISAGEVKSREDDEG